MGSILYWQGDAQRATDLYDEALRFYRQAGDEQQIADALYNAAWGAVGRNDITGSVEYAREAVEHYMRADDQADAARVTAFLRTGAYVMGGGGTKEDAVATAREAVEASRRQGRLYDMADWLGSVAFAYFRAGDHANAVVAFKDSIRAWREMENVGMLPMLKVGAAIELGLGRPERAARLAAVAERAVEEIGGELPEAMIGDIDPLEQARKLLSEDVFDRAVEEGRAMTFHQAAAYALEESLAPGEDAGKTTVPPPAPMGARR